MDKILYNALNKRAKLVIKSIKKDIKLINKAKNNDYKTIDKWYWSGTTWSNINYKMVLDIVDLVHSTDYVSAFFKYTGKYDDVYYPHVYARRLLTSLSNHCEHHYSEDNIGKIKLSKFALLYNLRKANPHYAVIINDKDHFHVLTKSRAISRLKKAIRDVKSSTAKANKALKSDKKVKHQSKNEKSDK